MRLTSSQTCVRNHLFLMSNAKTVEELIKNNPPITDEEMQSFLDGDDDLLTCSIQTFRIDFVRSNAFIQRLDDWDSHLPALTTFLLHAYLEHVHIVLFP